MVRRIVLSKSLLCVLTSGNVSTTGKYPKPKVERPREDEDEEMPQ